MRSMLGVRAVCERACVLRLGLTRMARVVSSGCFHMCPQLQALLCGFDNRESTAVLAAGTMCFIVCMLEAGIDGSVASDLCTVYICFVY